MREPIPGYYLGFGVSYGTRPDDSGDRGWTPRTGRASGTCRLLVRIASSSMKQIEASL
jgi:hypothetical protein